MNISSVGSMPPAFGMGLGGARSPIEPTTVLEDIGVDIGELDALAATIGETGESLEAAVGESATMRDVMTYVVGDRGGDFREALGGFATDMGFTARLAGSPPSGSMGAGIDVEAITSKYLEFLFSDTEDADQSTDLLELL